MYKIRQLLSEEQSKTIRDEIVKIVLDAPKEIESLMDCFFDDNFRLNQYASWPITVIGEKRPLLIFPYLAEMLAVLDNPAHDAVIRNTIRVMQNLDIPEELEGEVYDRCFGYFVDPKEKPAIRVFSMTVLTNIALKYPDLKEELVKSIELYFPFGSAGFKSRAKKELKRLRS